MAAEGGTELFAGLGLTRAAPVRGSVSRSAHSSHGSSACEGPREDAKVSAASAETLTPHGSPGHD